MNFWYESVRFYFLCLKGKNVVKTTNSTSENKVITRINQFGGKTNPKESLNPIG